MDIFLGKLLDILLSKNVLFVIPLIIIWVFVTWFARNKVERVFLSKNIALLQRALSEIGVFVFLTFLGSLALNINTDYLRTTNAFSISLFTITVLLYVLLFSLNNNFRGLREKRFISNPITLFTIFLLTSLFLFSLYSYFIQIAMLGLAESLQLNSNYSREILFYLISNNSILSFLTYILIMSAILYFPLRVSFGVTLLEFLKWNRNDSTSAITIVLKNGKTIPGVYMKNNAPSDYLHFHNKEELPTQYIVINKQEIEYLLFTDPTHKIEANIRINPEN